MRPGGAAVKPGTQIAVPELKQGGKPTEHVFYGPRAIEARTSPIAFDLNR